MNKPAGDKKRFLYIDQFRGLVVILMLLDHASYYFDSVWKHFDPLDPVFDSWGQFIVRYLPYLCAPGFLMMAGAMVWWSYHQRVEKGTQPGKARWHLIQRGLFLVLLQVTWVNSSWGGFRTFDLIHIGIIACIGISMIFLTFFVNAHWIVRLAIGLAALLIHPFLLKIPYGEEGTLSYFVMQTFVDAGDFNKYPVLPWFALAVLGSVMAEGWLKFWQTDRKRILMSLVIGLAAMVLSLIVRIGMEYGNIFSYSNVGSFSFFYDQKYPPSLFMNLWFFGMVVIGIALFIVIGRVAPGVLAVFSIPGKVALFFYGMHIAIMGVFVKRLNFQYREGGITETLIGLAVMLLIMLPLCKWFYGIKRRSKNPIIQMI